MVLFAAAAEESVHGIALRFCEDTDHLQFCSKYLHQARLLYRSSRHAAHRLRPLCHPADAVRRRSLCGQLEVDVLGFLVLVLNLLSRWVRPEQVL
jgi:hypothetical protein